MSDWTQAAGSPYLTGDSVVKSGGVVRAKVTGITYDEFPDGRKPVLEVSHGGMTRKVAINATNMAVLVAFLKGKSEAALVGKTVVLGVVDARNPRTNTVGPSIRITEVRA